MRSAIVSLVIVSGVLAISATARAQPVTGLYVSGALGPNFLHDRSVSSPAASEFAPAPVPAGPQSATAGIAGRGSVAMGLATASVSNWRAMAARAASACRSRRSIWFCRASRQRTWPVLSSGQ